MGSNKRHKSEKSRDAKKKRHRSLSRSCTPEREKLEKLEKHGGGSGNGSGGGNNSSSSSSRHHHKKHRRTRERKDYDSDVEIIDAPPPPKISRSSHPSTPPPPEISRRTSPSPGKGTTATVQQLSLSIEETNELRAKLGLKPLDVDGSTTNKDDTEKLKDDLGEFYHKPAPNIAEKLKSQTIKERLNVQKQKRRIEADLAKVKTLGERDSDELHEVENEDEDHHDDIQAWVDKSRRLQEEKRKAEERAKMLDQLDEEFGIGDLLKEEMRGIRSKTYTEKDLKGLKVEHALDNLTEGKTMILTLKDQDVLEGDNDILINTNMLDDERYKRRVINKIKKPGYDAYDDDNFDEFGQPKKNVLEKYDEEIHGEKKDSFILGSNDLMQRSRFKLNVAERRLENKRLETLQLPEPKLASEYYDEEELTKFKKLKKKVRKIRKKKLRADDLVPENNDYLRDLGSRRDGKRTENKVEGNDGGGVGTIDNDILDVDDITEPPIDTSGIKLEDDNKEPELQLALKKARRLRMHPSNIQKVVETIKQENNTLNENRSGNIVLNATAEFCRTLGDIPTYGLSGNREESGQELMDFEVDEIKDEPRSNEEEDDGRGAWNAVRLDECASEPMTQEAAILDAEPSLGQGVAGALKLAMSKGYLQKEDNSRPSASRFAHLQAQNYSIEDKTYGDDDKFGRRDRFNGPTSEFKEKDGFKPNVKLEYIDDDGHVLSAKEAFRYLSHKFHGKGPGKNKVEKRMKKAEQEVLMKRMSSTDTPLGTLNLLQAKQKETQSPYIVLSGSKHMQTSISKTKH